jgi:hypothetical protein
MDQKRAAIGMGGANVGGWRCMDLTELAAMSPQLALARAWGVVFAPYVLSAKATFTDPAVSDIPNVGLEGGIADQRATITRVSVVDRLVFEVLQPNAFAGAQLKSVSDYFFRYTTGISATLDVVGAPRYAVAPFFTPIETLAAMVNEGWPSGWIIEYTQSIKMAFHTDIPLPSLPTKVTATFRMWQPVDDRFITMTNNTARLELEKLGIQAISR